MNWNYNNLLAWDDSVGNIPNVKLLDVANKGLTELPLKIFKLVSLQEFDCSFNEL